MVHIFVGTEIAERPPLDRLLGKSILDRFVHKTGVSEDASSASSNEPENSRYWGSKDAEGNGDDQESRVKLRGGCMHRAYQVKLGVFFFMRQPFIEAGDMHTEQPVPRQDRKCKLNQVVTRKEETLTNVQISPTKPSNPPHTPNNQKDDEQQKQIRQKRIDAKHNKDDGIIARKIS